MPIRVDGNEFYRTNEVCEIVGISKSTLFRWIQNRTIDEVKLTDRRGWRLFSEQELQILRSEAYRVQPKSAERLSIK
jgi:excisionase family DNA binding protein